MGIATRDHGRAPLTNRGPSKDQPAPGSARHIPFDAPEPGPHVTAVAVLEQNPAHERWERTREGGWLHAGYRGNVRPEPMVVPWSKVGMCGRGTKHDLKDVSDRAAQWNDRPTDGLPERRFVVTVEIRPDHGLSPAALRGIHLNLREVSTGRERTRLAFAHEATTPAAAVAAIARVVESAGLYIEAISAE